VKKTIKPLFVSNPDLLKYKFAPMEDHVITARDGLEMVAYLTRADTEKKTFSTLGSRWTMGKRLVRVQPTSSVVR